MKKFALVSTALIIVVTAFGFSISPANAAPASNLPPPPTTQSLPPLLVLDSPYFNGLTSGQQVPAQMFINSNMSNIYCVALDSIGHIQCLFPRKYARQAAVLYIQAGGKTLIFWVTIPKERKVVQVIFE